MKIEHIAMYVNDLEKAKDFFVDYFGGYPNAEYHNTTTEFRSYFITFDEGARLEIMKKPHVADCEKILAHTGYIHIAFSVGSKEAVDALTERLKKAGFERPEQILASYVFHLSGGQKQRVALAMLLSFSPQLILLDEPTAALDIVAVRQLLDAMHLELARGASILMVTHHIHAAAYLAGQFLVLQKGQVVEAGRSADILHHPQHPYTKELIASALQIR